MSNRILSLTCLLTLSACMVGATAHSIAADIRGKVTNISVLDQKDPYASVRIEGVKEADTTFDKAVARVMLRTKLFKFESDAKIKAEWADFKIGQTVEATFAGPVAESYPVQGAASEIVILADATTEQPATRTENPADPLREGEIVTVFGMLRGSGMAVGGETTGWMVSYSSSKGLRHLEVDIGEIDWTRLEGKLVRITAKVVTRNYLERGPTLILKALKIELQNP